VAQHSHPHLATHLAGKAVLVTGGGKGIGRAITTAFLAAGADVVICGRSEVDTIDLPAVDAAGGRRVASYVQVDIRDPEQQVRLIEETVRRLGRLDILINNAGGSPTADARTSSPRLTASVMALNLVAPFQLAQASYSALSSAPGGGLIINIGSVAGTDPAPGTSAYAAAKAGLSIATRALAREFAPAVRVNQVTVGLVVTELSGEYYGSADGLAAVASTIPMGRMATPEDIAAVCVLLCAPEAAYVTGASLLVDGGGQFPAWQQAADV